MRLDLSTWEQIESYLSHSDGIILPIGSTEQHGPVGLIGTDTICATAVAERAADQVGALLLPPVAYTPAPFNMGFPGTVSVSPSVFEALVREIAAAVAAHGFRKLYLLNAHGANLEPLRRVAADAGLSCRLRSWWEFAPVAALRRELYGDWEGMHATPSEVAITQAVHRVVEREPMPAPKKLTAEYIAAHSGDRHGPPEEHRRDFPDGRVGAWSELARPEHGHRLLALAAQAVAEDYLSFVSRSEDRPLSLGK